MFYQRILGKKRMQLILVLLIAFALRMWDIDARSLWFDEAFEYWSASVDFARLPQTVLTAYQPPLYTFILHVWLNFGTEATWLRFLSVMLSMLSLVGMLKWNQRLFGAKGVLISGFIMAFLPIEIRYAQEAAEYALAECLLVWVLYFLCRACQSRSWRFWVMWGLFSVLSIYSHYGASIVVVPTAIIAFLANLLSHRRDRVLKQCLIALLGAVLGIPLLTYFLPDQIERLQSACVPATSFQIMELSKLVSSIENTFLFHLTGWPFSSLPKWPSLIVIATVIGTSLVILAKSSSKAQKYIPIWFLSTYLVYFLLVSARLYAYGNYGFRYSFILSPLFIVTITTVADQFIQWRKSLAAVVLVAVIIGLAAYSIPNRFVSQVTRGRQAWPETEDLREVTKCWNEHQSKGDTTYVYYGALPAFRYYIRLYELEPDDPLAPTWYSACWKQEPVAYCSSHNIFYGEWFRELEPEEKHTSIQRTLGHIPERLWLVFSHVSGDEDQTILQSFSQTHDVIFSCEQANASAYLLSQR